MACASKDKTADCESAGRNDKCYWQREGRELQNGQGELSVPRTEPVEYATGTVTAARMPPSSTTAA